MTGSWRNGRIYHFYLQSIAFKVLVSADLHSWLLLLPGSTSGSHLHALSMCDTLNLDPISIISPGTGITNILTNTDSTNVRSKSTFQHIISSTRCFQIVFKPKQTQLPAKQRWCQRMFATLWIRGSFCLWSACQNASGSSLVGDWDNSVQYPLPAASHTLCFLREQCPTCLDATQTNGSLVAIRQNRYTYNNVLPKF